MKLRLSLELHVTRSKPNKPEPAEDPQPRGDNHAATERAHPDAEGTLNRTLFSIASY